MYYPWSRWASEILLSTLTCIMLRSLFSYVNITYPFEHIHDLNMKGWWMGRFKWASRSWGLDLCLALLSIVLHTSHIQPWMTQEQSIDTNFAQLRIAPNWWCLSLHKCPCDHNNIIIVINYDIWDCSSFAGKHWDWRTIPLTINKVWNVTLSSIDPYSCVT